MAVKIRQEINILNHSVSSADTSGEKVQLDTSQYVNPTYYLEIVANNTSASNWTVSLRDVTGSSTISGSDITVPANTTSYTRYRTNALTLTAGAREYRTIQLLLVNTNLKVARLIIIDEPTTLISSETQIEIGNHETSRTNESSAPLANPKYWLYTAANWDGTKTFYAEATYDSGSMDTITVTLQEDDGSFGSWADLATIVSAGTTTTPTRTRVSFTPTDGRHYRIASLNGSMDDHDLYNAKIIVDQEGA